MRGARHAQAPTLLVGDIDRGGVFAHLLGTLELLSPEDRALVRGFVINRFRGDPSLLGPAIEVIKERTGVPVLGVLPWIDNIGVAEEDAVALERPDSAGDAGDRPEVDVAVMRLPRIANFDDFDPLAREPGVRVRWVRDAADFGRPDLAVLPGTKATVADLEWLRGQGPDGAIEQHAASGGAVLGICGGFQMLGELLVDEEGVEAAPGTRTPGLGLLPVETRFVGTKTTRQASGEVLAGAGPWARPPGSRSPATRSTWGSTPVRACRARCSASTAGPTAPCRPMAASPGRTSTACCTTTGCAPRCCEPSDAAIGASR